MLFVGKRKRRLWHESPWDGQRGFWAAWNRFIFHFQGPGQLGRADEPAYVPAANPGCPLCGHPSLPERGARCSECGQTLPAELLAREPEA